MKLWCLLPVLLVFFTPQAAPAAELKRLAPPFRIAAVTVYPDRALVARSATVSLKPGSYLIACDNLPPLLQDEALRVEGEGSAGATIVGLEVKRVFLEASGTERIKAIDEEIRTLEARRAVLAAKLAGLTAQKDFYQSIRVAWGERISKELALGRPTAAELGEAAGLIGSGVTKAEEQALDYENERRSLAARIDALQRQRREIGGGERKESKSVEVQVEVAREGTLTLRLATVLPGAGWQPVYDARLAADGQGVELTFRALVAQESGEDWNEVDLTLSTARPAVGSAPPELFPWLIALLRPAPPMPEPPPFAAAPRPKIAQLMAERGSADETVAAAPAAIATATIENEAAALVFHLPRPVTVPADGTPHASVVAVETWPAALEYLAIPKLSPAVYRRAELVNRAAYPLLPGEVNTFVGLTFTGSARLSRVAAGEPFELGFGVDDQLTVKRQELKQHKEAGLFGKNRVSYRYRVDLANYRKDGVTLTLRDQLPLAGDEEIKATLDQPSLTPDEVGTDGRLTWKLPLAAGVKRELSFGIVIEYPKERELSGL